LPTFRDLKNLGKPWKLHGTYWEMPKFANKCGVGIFIKKPIALIYRGRETLTRFFTPFSTYFFEGKIWINRQTLVVRHWSSCPQALTQSPTQTTYGSIDQHIRDLATHHWRILEIFQTKIDHQINRDSLGKVVH
jgi:hypothetical protein